MKRTVEKGKTLLVDGPASVVLLSGKAEVFSFQLKPMQKIVVRESKRLPFLMEETGVLEVSLGAEAAVGEAEGSTIPHSWLTAFQRLREIQKKPAVAMVVGGSDLGKSSFCTYLANRLVADRFEVVILDEDLGQSDIGPPCTVAYARLTKPATDMFNLKPQNVFFVGATSPSGAMGRTVEATGVLMKEILSKPTGDYVIVNTDGWVAGELATAFKSELAEVVEPDLVFCIQQSGVGPPVCPLLAEALGNAKVEAVEAATAAWGRSREVRRSVRELGFVKYLENCKVKVYTLNHLTIEGRESYSLIWQHQAENLLIGLHDGKKRFLGIGVIREVNYERKALKVQTAVTERPLYVRFGKVRLDRNLHEIPY